MRLFVSLALVTAALPAAGQTVRFNRDIRPILSDKCYHCHGPDEQGRKAQLRFDTREGALRIKDDFAVIVPGHSAESELIFRIKSTDDEEIMPPPEAKIGRLTPDEIATLQRWIDEGAKYQTHWSFEPLAPVTPPAPTNLAARAPAVSPIDRFIFAGLARRQLTPQPEADRVTLIRRLAFDLTGLPPALADIDAFVADRSPDALPRLVDRLLASPRYGERMAADWLDVARYADSYGFQVDRERDMWPWRDWVIKAFNQNLTWDKFVTYQLAGDLLPQATDEQILATAFNRLHAQEAEGGSIEERPRHHLWHGLPRPHARVLPLSRPQVRPDLPKRFLRALGVLPKHRRSRPLFIFHSIGPHARAPFKRHRSTGEIHRRLRRDYASRHRSRRPPRNSP